MSTTNLVGSFSLYTCEISPEAKRAFEEALGDIVGVTYSPVAVSEQIVAGINYKFFCNTEAAIRFPTAGAAIVSIYQPPSGQAHLTHIQSL